MINLIFGMTADLANLNGLRNIALLTGKVVAKKSGGLDEFILRIGHSRTYQEISRFHMIECRTTLDPERVFFQQDNATSYTARATRNFFVEHRIAVIDWPLNFPDSNPMENLWVVIKNRLDWRYEVSSRNFIQKIEMMWEEIEQETLDNLVSLMDSRLKQCIGRWGDRTDY